MATDLTREQVKQYLTLITEAIIKTSNNTGSLRQKIWDYIMSNYEADIKKDEITYRDFLLACRKFLIEGKLINNEGNYSMAEAVIEEMRQKSPSPDLKVKKVVEALKTFEKMRPQGSSAKKPKVDNKQEPQQSKLVKYYQKKQMSPVFQEKARSEMIPQPSMSFGGLGFQNGAARKGSGQSRLANDDFQVPHSQSAFEHAREKSMMMRRKLLESNLKQSQKQIFKGKRNPTQLVKQAVEELGGNSTATHQQKPMPVVQEAQPQKPKEEILTAANKKALKKAIKLKNIRPRKQTSPPAAIVSPQDATTAPKKMISEKSKAIKKSDHKKFEESLRFVKEKDGKFSVKKLRGKTLDLTEMGILKKKLDIQVEVKPVIKVPKIPKEPKMKKTKAIKKVAKVNASPKKEKKVQRITKNRIQAKQVRAKTAEKAKLKILKVDKQKLTKEKIEKQKFIKKRLASVKRQLITVGAQMPKLSADRKAKLDAVKFIQQLYISKKTHTKLYIDGKLIYV